MKLDILGKQYDHLRAVEKAPLRDLILLSEQGGVGPRAIKTVLVAIFTAGSDEAREELSDKPDTIKAMLSLAWLCKRMAGEEVVYGELDLSYSDLKWHFEDSDFPAEAEPDLTTASGDQTPNSEETLNEPAPKRRNGSAKSPKTSKSPSSVTS